MKIEWRTCPQNRNYQISNTGLCKSLHNRFEGKYLTPVRTRYADMYVMCTKYTKHKYRAQHLVYTAFVGKVQRGYVVYNKDGNVYNNNLDNLAIMPLADKIFYFAKRAKKLPRMTLRNQYTFIVNGKTYNSSRDVIEDYPEFGTRQNLCDQADRWIRGGAPRGKVRESNGFMIKGILIWATKKPIKNKTKKRMDRIKANIKTNA